tara:strand:+ start:7344 stop:8843 length:1500 start_codon:yes stop_codon:yes gene_type:complete
MATDSNDLSCEPVNVCSPFYVVVSNVGGSQIDVTPYTDSPGTAAQCLEWIDNNSPNNPCPSVSGQTVNSCCKEGETYTPVDSTGLCRSTCLEWSMVEDSLPKEWEFKETTIEDGVTCAGRSQTFTYASNYEFNVEFESDARCLLNEYPLFSSNGRYVCKDDDNPCRSNFDNVKCHAPEIYAEVLDVINLAGPCSTSPLSLASVFESSNYDKIKLSEGKKGDLLSDLCKVYDLGIGSNLKVVVGTEQRFPSLQADALAEYYNITQLPESVQEGSNYDDYADVIIPQVVNITSHPGLFGRWTFNEQTVTSPYVSTDHYFILSSNLTECGGFYQSSNISDYINNGSDTYDLVDFTRTLYPYTRKTCPIDPFYSNLAHIDTACTPATPSGGSITCCVSNYRIESSNYSPSTDGMYVAGKICTDSTPENCVLSESTEDIAVGGPPYSCGPARESECGNILNDQGSANLINMYPGYDYEYINYASTTHKYFNGNHGDDPSICVLE